MVAADRTTSTSVDFDIVTLVDNKNKAMNTSALIDVFYVTGTWRLHD